MASERLQKILARGGVASRRAAEQWITSGRVRVNGRVVTELGAKADPATDRIEVDGTRLIAESFVYVALHKPRGVVATLSDPEGRPTVRELLGGIDARVYPVGRLDFATSGILLVTNDGSFADGLLHPRKAVPKTYVLKAQGEMQPEDIERWRTGVRLEDGMTLPADASLIRHEAGKTWLQLTIREGRNQQIRRMGEATGFRVMRLARLSFAGISSEGLRPGAWRHLTRDELIALRQAYGVPTKLPRPPEEASPAARRRPARRPGPRPTARTEGAPERDRGGDRGRGGDRDRAGGARAGAPRGGDRDRPSDRGRGEQRSRGAGRGGAAERERGGERARPPGRTGDRDRGAPARSGDRDRSRDARDAPRTPRAPSARGRGDRPTAPTAPTRDRAPRGGTRRR